uniref:Glycine cleavage system protein H n=1 Tax=Desulfobacca acetoxidans TaxID=60893 RepID=A0A7V4G975_9BACT
METARQMGQMVEIFGMKVPTDTYYVHRGHTWAVVEENQLVRVGLDDFSQKLMGPAEEVRLPEAGKTLFQDHVCLSLAREGHKVSFVAPVDGEVIEVNFKVRANPRLIHDDPYGEGWLVKVRPTNLKANLEKLMYGEAVAAWMDEEVHRLLNLMDTSIGVTLPSGGEMIDNVIGHYPALGWRRLAGEFFLRDMTKSWMKRS